MPEPTLITLDRAVAEIRRAHRQATEKKRLPPFFLVVGAGISHPSIPLAREIVEDCKKVALAEGPGDAPPKPGPLHEYAHWFSRAYPQPQDRREYFQALIDKKRISRANLRLAHLLLGEQEGSALTNLVFTLNFDDFLTRALMLFGKRHVVCDHPATTARIDVADASTLQLVHVHGSYFFYDCKNLPSEIASVAHTSERAPGGMASLLDSALRGRSPLVVGYSGWEGDAVMTALERRLRNQLHPYNLYWFCYQRSNLNSLPPWLREHPNVQFVVPQEPTPPAATQTQIVAREHLTQRSNTVPLESPPLHAELQREVLSAERVFERLLQAFELPSPRISSDALAFLSDQLEGNLPADDPLAGSDDLYRLKSVVAELRRGGQSAPAQRRKTGEPPLEPLRQAVRETRFAEAVKVARGASAPSGKPLTDEWVEFMELTLTAAEGLTDKPAQAIAACDLVVQLWRGNTATQGRVPTLAARALYRKGRILQAERPEDAIPIFGELSHAFGGLGEPAVRELVASALVRKATCFTDLGQFEEALATFNDMHRRFSRSTQPKLQLWIASAMYGRGGVLRELNQDARAIETFDELIERFESSEDSTLLRFALLGRFGKATTLGKLNRQDEELAEYDRILARSGRPGEPAHRASEVVVKASFNKAVIHNDRGDRAKALEVIQEIIRRPADDQAPGLMDVLGRCYALLGELLAGEGRQAEALSCVEDGLHRLGTMPLPASRSALAILLIEKGKLCAAMGRLDEGLAAFNDVIERFSNDPRPELREQVAEAIDRKRLALLGANRTAEALIAAAMLVSRFKDAKEPAIAQILARHHAEEPPPAQPLSVNQVKNV